AVFLRALEKALEDAGAVLLFAEVHAVGRALAGGRRGDDLDWMRCGRRRCRCVTTASEGEEAERRRDAHAAGLPDLLMMEQPNAGHCHGDAVLAASGDHLVVARRAARLGDEAHAVASRMVDVVAEGNEAVGSQTDAGDPGEKASLVVCGE